MNSADSRRNFHVKVDGSARFITGYYEDQYFTFMSIYQLTGVIPRYSAPAEGFRELSLSLLLHLDHLTSTSGSMSNSSGITRSTIQKLQSVSPPNQSFTGNAVESPQRASLISTPRGAPTSSMERPVKRIFRHPDFSPTDSGLITATSKTQLPPSIVEPCDTPWPSPVCQPRRIRRRQPDVRWDGRPQLHSCELLR